MENIDFKFLEFWTYYASKGTTNKNLRREYCFSTIFYGDAIQNNDYTLYIYKKGHEKMHDNNCLLTTEQLKEHIEEIHKIYKFEYKLKETEDKYILKFKINAPVMYHKIILSWLRYSYEFPFNIALYECFKLKNIKGFKRITLLNLFNVVGASMNYSKHGTSIHAIGEFHHIKTLLSYKRFKSIINKTIKNHPRCQINDLIPLKDLEYDFNYIKVPKDMKINHTDYWYDEKEFKKRLKIYKLNIKLLKENN